MLKKFTAAAAALALTAAFAVPARAADISAASAIVMDAGSGAVLFEKDADSGRLIASTTKIMTALVALENCGLDDQVRIPAECERVEGSSMYLRAGQTYSMRELLYGLMLESGNDAAVAVADHVAGGVGAFAELMNARAASLGCTGTHFVNPHGLDAAGHYSTARDLARITAAAMDNELFEGIVSTRTVSFGGRTYTNHNKLLWSCRGALGVKTGYTMKAGRILVSCVERDGLRLICVTISDPNDWADHAALYDEAFAKWEVYRVPGPETTLGSVPVVSGEKDCAGVSAASSVSVLTRRGAETNTVLFLPSFVYASAERGARAGRYAVVSDGREILSGDLVFAETVAQRSGERLTPWERMKRALGFGENPGRPSVRR